ncbi:methyltransferase regulatory domain-containing protein [Helicobacter pylori]|uniref:methyltransferase regulatory domain-containing protein n=1 Tax=Helicobacter pylori TaxID=210 RepID=UPI001FD07888|nr:methyltransferase regulatory domain-containing protein [Helicobacter pylori]UOS16393.1 methyltransferase regulatory domain-containing protein [Helicobacter pylori]UOS51447.1 methyltransferase regulatory domain-containing protein [Helicobacter pylori]
MDLPVLESFKNIQLQNQFNNILSSNAKYLVHEYLNQSYEPFDFAKLAAELSQAKLQFASPAHFARLLKPSYFLDKATLNKLNETPLSCKKYSKTCSMEWATKRIISSRIAKRASRF